MGHAAKQQKLQTTPTSFSESKTARLGNLSCGQCAGTARFQDKFQVLQPRSHGDLNLRVGHVQSRAICNANSTSSKPSPGHVKKTNLPMSGLLIGPACYGEV